MEWYLSFSKVKKNMSIQECFNFPFKAKGAAPSVLAGVFSFVDEFPKPTGAGEGFVFVADLHSSTVEEVLEAVLVQDAVDQDLELLHGKVDPEIIEAITEQGPPLALKLPEALLVQILEVMGCDPEFAEQFELLQRGQRGDFTSADLVENDLESWFAHGSDRETQPITWLLLAHLACHSR